jgi:hypothetical protein
MADESDVKNVKYPEANSLLITRNPQNGDIVLDYTKDNKALAQEIIYGHIITRVSVEFWDNQAEWVSSFIVLLCMPASIFQSRQL